MYPIIWHCLISIIYVFYSALSRQLSFFVEEDVIKELDYTEIDLVGDLSDTIRIEDKVLFTVHLCLIAYVYCTV